MDHAPTGRHAELETEFGCSDPAQAPCAILDAADINAGLVHEPGFYVPSRPVGQERTWLRSPPATAEPMHGSWGARPRLSSSWPKRRADAAGAVTDPDIATSARFIFDRAEHMSQGPLPAVVNLSIGGDFGPHDGSTPLEKALALPWWDPITRGALSLWQRATAERSIPAMRPTSGSGSTPRHG